MQADPAVQVASETRPRTQGGWLAGHRRLVAGAIALAVLAPLAWFLGTRPLAGPGLLGAISAGGDARGVGPLPGHEAPPFTLKDPSGQTITLRQFRGQVVLLNFWATWCAPCREEMPELERLYRDNKDQGLVVLAVSIDDASSARHVPEYLKEGHPSVGPYTFPVALDQKQEVAMKYKLLGVPASFFIDRDGVIRVVQPRVMSRQMMLDSLRVVLPEAR
jgi:cytochrome c biogenesis protein CcmG/thiol:disulfide interchange protein DsbE